MDRILIEKYTPYSQSIKWRIHDNYFKQRGADAWKQAEVPFDITSNSSIARQKAEIVYASIDAQFAKKKLTKKDRINVLEVGSGLGAFALRFLIQFEKICREKKSKYYDYIHYFFTDYSASNLRDAQKNPYLNQLEKDGKLGFYLFDATDISSLKPLNSDTPFRLKKKMFSAMIANYLHCILPLAIIRKKNNDYYEKWIRLFYESKKLPKNRPAFIDSMLTQPCEKNFLDNLKEDVSYKKISLSQFIKDTDERVALTECIQDFDTATVVYPYGSFQHFRSIIPYMKPSGSYLISDKGYTNYDYMYGEHECLPSVHGNSFAHSFNFPLVDCYVRKLGLASSFTTDENAGIQTMCISFKKRHIPQVAAEFDRHFIKNQYHHWIYDFNSTAQEYVDQKNFEQAIVYYKKCLKWCPYDAKYYYYLGKAHIDYHQMERAHQYFAEGAEHDYFSEYDFHFYQGFTAFEMGDYEVAIDYYQQSLESSGQSKYAHYNMGLCYERLFDYESARNSYQTALQIDPRYDLARQSYDEIIDF